MPLSQADTQPLSALANRILSLLSLSVFLCHICFIQFYFILFSHHELPYTLAGTSPF